MAETREGAFRERVRALVVLDPERPARQRARPIMALAVVFWLAVIGVGVWLSADLGRSAALMAYVALVSAAFGWIVGRTAR